MSADSRIIPVEALRNEVVIKSAPVVTATELLGGRVEEFGGLRLTESPIHGFRIESPTGVEILAFMPEARLGQDQFHRLLHSVSPYLENDEGHLEIYAILDDMELIDPQNPRRMSYLDPVHQRLGRNWTDYTPHFPLLLETLQDTGTDVVKGLISGCNAIILRGFHFKSMGVGLGNPVWSTPDAIHIGGLSEEELPDEASVELRLEDQWYDQKEHVMKKGYRDDDPRRIPLRFKLGDHARFLEVQYRDIFQARIPYRRVGSQQDRRYLDLNGVEIASANDLIPTLKFSLEGDKAVWNVSSEIDGDKVDLLAPYAESFGLPPGLNYDLRRFNPIAGLLTVAHLSPEVTDTWGPQDKAGDKGKPNDMGGAQVQVKVLKEREALANTRLVQAYTQHILRNAC